MVCCLAVNPHMAKPNSPFRLTPLRVYLISLQGGRGRSCLLRTDKRRPPLLVLLVEEERLATSPNRWRGSTDRTCILDRRCYPHTETVGSVGVWAVTNSVRYDCSSSTKPLMLPLGARYHADVTYLLPWMRINKGASALWYSELSLHQLDLAVVTRFNGLVVVG